MKLKKALFKDILFQYKKFFSYDIEFSLICGRNFIYLESLRALLTLVVSKDIDNTLIDDKEFSKLKLHINTLYKNIQSDCIKQYSNLKIDIYSKSSFINTLDIIYSDIIKNLKIYLLIYELLYREEQAKHEGMLIELNNAFAHILTYGLSSDKEDTTNINKANDHLTRGILDGIKALILINIDKIKSNKKLLQELIALRIEESRNIGKISDNKIVYKYIHYVTTIH